MWTRRLVGAVAVALGLSSIASGTAGADPAEPTNYRSNIVSIVPAITQADVEVIGGDTFLSLTVDRGHEAIVPDYGSAERPYLRFSGDGTVEVNVLSVAHATNDSRYGTTTDEFDPDADPLWREVSSDGSYAWHDHRIHLMVPDRLAVVDANGRVDLGGPDGTWEVPMVLDGKTHTVRGELIRLPAPSPSPWYAVAGALGVAIAWTGRRTRWRIPIVIAAVTAGALFVSLTQYQASPDAAGASPIPVYLTALALVCALTTLAISMVRGDDRNRARSSTVATTASAGAAAVLLWWAVSRLDVFNHALLPSDIPVIDRLVTATSLGVALAVSAGLVMPRSWSRPRFVRERAQLNR